jgi:uncharacterized Zn finger protein
MIAFPHNRHSLIWVILLVEKKCPQCGTIMEEGLLAGAPHWGKGTSVFHTKGCVVVAYHCPNCGYIMLYEKGK